MKPSWSGRFKLGVLNFKIQTAKAVEDESSGDIHRRHKDCDGRMGRKNYCKKCGEDIGYSDTYRSYRLTEDDHIKISKEQMKKVKEQTSSIEPMFIMDFDKIPNLIFSRGKYLILPDTEEDNKAKKRYSQVYEALKRTKKVLIAKWNYYYKDRLVAIVPYHNKLFIFKLVYRERVRRDTIEHNIELEKPKDKEVNTIIKYLNKEYSDGNLKEVRSDYNKKLEKVLAGEELEEPEETDEVMEALRQQIEESEEEGEKGEEKEKAKVKAK